MFPKSGCPVLYRKRTQAKKQECGTAGWYKESMRTWRGDGGGSGANGSHQIRHLNPLVWGNAFSASKWTAKGKFRDGPSCSFADHEPVPLRNDQKLALAATTQLAWRGLSCASEMTLLFYFLKISCFLRGAKGVLPR